MTVSCLLNIIANINSFLRKITHHLWNSLWLTTCQPHSLLRRTVLGTREMYRSVRSSQVRTGSCPCPQQCGHWRRGHQQGRNRELWGLTTQSGWWPCWAWAIGSLFPGCWRWGTASTWIFLWNFFVVIFAYFWPLWPFTIFLKCLYVCAFKC